MMLRRKETRRAGSTLIESALVYPVLFVVVLGIVMLGMATFRYQQVAHAAREGARWASVRGASYAKDPDVKAAGLSAATPDDVYTKAILPQMHGAPPAGITFSVTWLPKADGTPDKRPTRVITATGADGRPVAASTTNYVTVTVTYNWNTILFGTIPVSSTSTTPITF